MTKSDRRFLFANKGEDFSVICRYCGHKTYIDTDDNLRQGEALIKSCWYCHKTEWFVTVIWHENGGIERKETGHARTE